MPGAWIAGPLSIDLELGAQFLTHVSITLWPLLSRHADAVSENGRFRGWALSAGEVSGKVEATDEINLWTDTNEERTPQAGIRRAFSPFNAGRKFTTSLNKLFQDLVGVGETADAEPPTWQLVNQESAGDLLFLAQDAWFALLSIDFNVGAEFLTDVPMTHWPALAERTPQLDRLAMATARPKLSGLPKYVVLTQRTLLPD